MKKLSAVMAAAMCLTVGGVYATWNYANDATINDAVYEEQLKVQMGEIDDSATAASVKLLSNTMSMTVEGEIVDETVNCAVLTPVADTGLSIRIAINKTSTITDLQLTYTLTVTNAQYMSADIFSYTTTTFTVDVSKAQMTNTDPDNANVVYMVLDYTTEEIMEEFGLELSQAFNLPTKDEFDDFQAELIKTSLYVNVSVVDISPDSGNV